MDTFQEIVKVAHLLCNPPDFGLSLVLVWGPMACSVIVVMAYVGNVVLRRRRQVDARK